MNQLPIYLLLALFFSVNMTFAQTKRKITISHGVLSPNYQKTPAKDKAETTPKTESTTDSKSESKPASKERKGPTNIPFFVDRELVHDYDFSADILNSFDEIYRDANIHSGYYYYAPKAYVLGFSKETGEYEFNVNYNSGGSGNSGAATVTAILRPKLNRQEAKLTKELLKQNIKGNPEQVHGVTDLIPIPIRQQPEIVFDNLNQFGITANDISIRAPSDLEAPIYLSFTTANIDDLMGMFFNNIGLYGNVILYPDGEDMKESISLPFELRIDDPATFGALELTPRTWRQNGWKNKTDYPILLNAFHVMKKEKTGKFQIYTWKINNVEVPEHASVKFNSSKVPAWIDTDPSIKKMWMEYTVKSCQSCEKIVKDKIIGGTAGSRIQHIEVDILTPLEFTEAELIKIKLRSFQADPSGNTKQMLATLRIEEDIQTLDGGKLYVPDGATTEFEYQIQVIMPDGARHTSRWIKSKDQDIAIGERQIKKHISFFE